MKLIYDNSNLNESYSGITTPLTYSFAKGVYAKVYINLCNLFGVSSKDMKKNSDLFPNMLEYIGGRMYYNLINWYRLVALLPGYKFNRKFLEQMLGVSKEHYFLPEQNNSLLAKAQDFLNLIYRLLRMILLFIFMKLLVRKFNRNFDKKLEEINKVDLKRKSPASLIKFYSTVEKKLTKDFSIPIANDFAVMISVGVLRSVSQKWLKDKNGSISNYFISGGVGIKSAEPGKHIQKIIIIINKNKIFRDLFAAKSIDAIFYKLNSHSRYAIIKKEIHSYIKKYGSRMPGELKLESISFQDDPLVLIKLIKASLNNYPKMKVEVSNNSIEIRLHNVSLHKRVLFNMLLRWTQSSIAMREETRFRRTLIFDKARGVFKELGEKLKKQQIISNSGDVFYLSKDEIFNHFHRGDNQEIAFLDLVRKRKKLETNWKEIDLPRRIITKFSPDEYIQKLFKSRKKRRPQEVSKVKVLGQLASYGNSGSVVVGESLVVTEFNPSKDYNNKILVTKQTDPGWTIIFPSLKGLVVERGGALSHAAIVAREFGIPCIINALNATAVIPNRTKIEMNLKTGVVSQDG